MAQFDRQAQRGRLHLLSALFVGVGLLLAYRFADLQYVQHERFAELAHDEHFQTESIAPRRGALLDSTGRPLALSVLYDAVYVVGAEVTEPREAAAQLGPILGLTPDDILG